MLQYVEAHILLCSMLVMVFIACFLFFSRKRKVYIMFDDMSLLIHNYLICKVCDLRRELSKKVEEDPGALTEYIIEERYNFYLKEYNFEKIISQLISTPPMKILFSFYPPAKFINQSLFREMIQTVEGREEEIAAIINESKKEASKNFE
jgi:hypothetical protein